MTWSDPNTVDNPTTGQTILTTWGDMVNQNLSHVYNRRVWDWVKPKHTTTGGNEAVGSFPSVELVVGGSEYAYFSYYFQEEFAPPIYQLYVAFTCIDGTGTLQYDIATTYGAYSESYNAHTGSLTNQTLAVTQNKLYLVSAKNAVPNLAAFDLLGLSFHIDSGPGSRVNVLGMITGYDRS